MATSNVAVTGTTHQPRPSSGDSPAHKKGVARKLTCSVMSVVLTGVSLILVCQVALIYEAVPEWRRDLKEAMEELEKENLPKLALDKASFVTEVFGRVAESALQLQAFAEQALLETPETMVVDQYLKTHPGLQQEEATTNNSAWYISGYAADEIPPANSSLEGLLQRSALMDIPFRGMQGQHLLVYLAALDDPAMGSVSEINFQSYVDEDVYSSYESFTDPCPGFSKPRSGYDPRCRQWYQDATASGDRNVVITNPYADAGSEELAVTVAAPVYARADSTLLLGVVGLDVDFDFIEDSVNNLEVIQPRAEGGGYAYMLAPGDSGEVAAHYDLPLRLGRKTIYDLEPGLDTTKFNTILTKMSTECVGWANYSNNGTAMLLWWAQENASKILAGEEDCNTGFIVVVTISEDALVEAFSNKLMDIDEHLFEVTAIMAAILVAVGCLAVCFARWLSRDMTEPVNQLIDIVQALNHMDFSEQAAGTWMLNKIASPEVEELMDAFKAMVTVVKSANMILGKGDVDLALESYTDAKVLFTKLKNDRGVAIVNNNLGNVYTLQARQLADQAAAEKSRVEADRLFKKAMDRFSDAEISFRLAIDDARMLVSGQHQHTDQGSGQSAVASTGESKTAQADVEAQGATLNYTNYAEHDRSSQAALSLQLANRMFNLALCLAAKGNSAVPAGEDPDFNAINEARRLMHECAKLVAGRNDAKGDQRQVECLLELAKLERAQPGREKDALDALDSAEGVIVSYRGLSGRGSNGGGDGGSSGEGPPQSPSTRESLPPPLAVLRQQLLVERGAQCVAMGSLDAAIEHWTDAVIGCGDRMDARAVRASLVGLREQAENGNGPRFPRPLLTALRIPPGTPSKYGFEAKPLVAALELAITKMNFELARSVEAAYNAGPVTTDVDLCFVMDCTGSMQSWIDQAKSKLIDIIAQAKKDVVNLRLRVSFVGYRDFGDKTQYEGPYDFHTEEEIPKLVAKLERIEATGGGDMPEDIAGGLSRAVGLAWKSPTRLCILIADAPCHGTFYHNFRDNYPAGCPKGLDPSKLLYTLQYELGVDFYFVRITSSTDKMLSIFHSTVASYAFNAKERPTLRGTENAEPKFVIHDLGSNDNRFLEVVVDSVLFSAGTMDKLRVEEV